MAIGLNEPPDVSTAMSTLSRVNFETNQQHETSRIYHPLTAQRKELGHSFDFRLQNSLYRRLFHYCPDLTALLLWTIHITAS